MSFLPLSNPVHIISLESHLKQVHSTFVRSFIQYILGASAFWDYNNEWKQAIHLGTRPVLSTLCRAFESLEGAVNMQMLLQQVWAKACGFAFLTSPVTLIDAHGSLTPLWVANDNKTAINCVLPAPQPSLKLNTTVETQRYVILMTTRASLRSLLISSLKLLEYDLGILKNECACFPFSNLQTHIVVFFLFVLFLNKQQLYSSPNKSE